MKTSDLKKELQRLAHQYENPDFLKEDPSQFMHRFKRKKDKEVVAFISAMLSFGNRRNILKKMEEVLKFAGETPAEWIISGEFEKAFPKSSKKFYRFFSYADMNDLFCELRRELLKSSSLGKSLFCESSKCKCKKDNLAKIIGHQFQKSRIVPKGEDSACKRTWLFLRWMVRPNSPVDLGIWNWYDASELLIPLDTHVLQESKKLGLTKRTGTSYKTAKEITEKLKKIFPGDPCKGDFALFGKGVENSK